MNYAEIVAPSDSSDAARFTQLATSRLSELPTSEGRVEELSRGDELTSAWLSRTGFSRPVRVHDSRGLGLRVPPRPFGVRDVALSLGPEWPVEVLDVGTQSEVPGSWTLGDWAAYFATPAAARRRTLNVLTLEVSGTPLGDRVRAPRAVRSVDWIDTVWPGGRRGAGEFPAVQKYCLMSVAGCYTDFHVDFGGTSVWYHVHTGAKTFVLAPPTPQVLQTFGEWSRGVGKGAAARAEWLPDVLPKGASFSVSLRAGETLLIPAGWVHAVYTPQDSLVFGGNFLHGFAMETQLRIFDLENLARIKKRYVSARSGRDRSYSCLPHATHKPLAPFLLYSSLRSAFRISSTSTFTPLLITFNSFGSQQSVRLSRGGFRRLRAAQLPRARLLRVGPIKGPFQEERLLLPRYCPT